MRGRDDARRLLTRMVSPAAWGRHGPHARVGARALSQATLAALLVALLAACGSPGAGSQAPGQSTSGAPGAGSDAAATGTGAAAGEPRQAGASETARAGASPIPVRVAYTGASGSFAPLWVTHEEGYFREQGLDVSLTAVQPAPGAQALIAGDFDVETMGPQVLDGQLGGADLVYIADIVPAFVLDIYTRPDVQDAAGLRGGTIGVTQAGATTDYAARAYARHIGLEAGRDVEISFVGSTPALVAALSNNLITAAVLSPPSTLMARKAGMRKLVALADLKLPFQHTALAARRAWVRENEDTVRRFTAALTKGLATTKHDQAVAMRVIGQYMRTEDPEEQREAHEAFKDVYPTRPVVSREAVQAVIDASSDPRARSLNVEQLIYDSLVP